MEELSTNSVVPLTTDNWYTCGYTIYNYLGTHVATFSNITRAQYNSPSYPGWWNLVSGYNSTWAASMYSWTNLSGPTPNPGWNNWDSYVYTYSKGILNYLGGQYWYHATNSFDYSSGWSCSAGSGQ